jgi:protein TonB
MGRLLSPTPRSGEQAVAANVLIRSQQDIQPDGHATDVEIVKGPGLGLEEKAVKAVRTWRFKPALGPNGKPVATITPIEVNFRLL